MEPLDQLLRTIDDVLLHGRSADPAALPVDWLRQAADGEIAWLLDALLDRDLSASAAADH